MQRPLNRRSNDPQAVAPDSSAHRRGNLLLPNLTIPPLTSFRPQISVADGESSHSIVRRKPLPVNASPLTPRYTAFQQAPEIPPKSPKRSFSLGSPIFLPNQPPNGPLGPVPAPLGFVPRDLDRHPRGTSPRFPEGTPGRAAYPPRKSSLPNVSHKPTVSQDKVPPNRSANGRPRSGSHKSQGSSSGTAGGRRKQSTGRHRSQTMTSVESRTFHVGLLQDDLATPVEEHGPPSFAVQVPKQRSPSKKLGSFFSWKRNPSLESPTTTYSDRSASPLASPLPAYRDGSTEQRPLPPAIDVHRANAGVQHHLMPQTPLLPLPTPPATNTHVAELERELQEISAELANSIKREMELEDELERYKLESSSINVDTNRRTSDYYSDSGAGSVKYSLGDSEGRIEELERLRRKAEQDKAQTKLDMSQRLEDALRTKRQVEERLSSPGSDTPKLRQLEAALEEARRKFKEERQCRESYESLIASMKMELVQRQNESENLRDEVVPQLKARIEGLENEAADKQKLVYENSRMQQELEKLRNEHETFMSARRMQLEMQKQQDRMVSISEDNLPLSMQPGLSRTRSLAAKSRSRANSTASRPGSARENTGTLTRSNSIREPSTESREVLTQSLRDIEAQRAALHSALKNLILRQTHMEKQHAKRIKALEQEKDKATNLTPQRSTFQREVRNLREEVVDLRRRADEALEQKWRCENGLSGLKMDLDRAQQETNSLRQLLQERDIFVPDRPTSRSGRTLDPETPGSLDKAYKELRTTHALSIASVQALEAQDSLGLATTEAEKTLELLKKSISDAEVERNLAQKQAAQYRDEARKLQRSELEHLNKEQSLASELYASAQRMDELASQVQTQLQSNSLLRQRLAEAIGRGELEQKSSAVRIAQMQGRLRELEDQLMTAQQHSEHVVASHEEVVRRLHDAQNAQLKRAKSGMSPSSTAPPSPLNPFSMKSPRISRTTSGNGMTFAEATRTGYLENRVKELEKALTDADREMEEVVQRMNSAQIEVAELQSERDEAMMRTRKLQAEIMGEREKVKLLMSEA